MNYYIFIGPKKTGTSSVYTILKKNLDHDAYDLLPKESNILLKNTYGQNYKSKNLIDISPEYFSSFRAIFNVCRLSKEHNIQIIILRRSSERKFNSHLEYMLKKREISETNLSVEFEKLFLQDDYSYFASLWKKIGRDCFEFEIGSNALNEFMLREFNIFGEFDRENIGQFRTTRYFGFMKLAAMLLRQLGFAKYVEAVASTKSVRGLAYIKGGDDARVVSEFEEKVFEFRKLLRGGSGE